jgi:hypothetical protein
MKMMLNLDLAVVGRWICLSRFGVSFLAACVDGIIPCAVINMLCLFMAMSRILDYKPIPG